MRSTHICSGIIINSRHILTSASCVVLDKSVFFANIKIRAGSNDLLDDQYACYRDVSSIIIHPDFNMKNFWDNDISILVLSKELTLNGYTIDIGRFSKRRTIKERLAVTGWGRDISNDFSISHYLRKIYIQRLRPVQCQNLMKRFFNDNQGCAYGHPKTTSVTQGDSGGPLLRNFEIIGIVSVFSITLERQPFVFIKVEEYLRWIDLMTILY
ncbi:trypsin-3-like [Aphidius gifuensis]|nr:trypsin-3-like [Aphidius gifuensis]